MMNMMQTCIDKALGNNIGSMSNNNALLANNGQLFGMPNSANNNANDNCYFPPNIDRKYE
jgi:hypothetical protein